MEITKSGEIKACCEWCENEIETGDLEWDEQRAFLIYDNNILFCYLDFCPSCGARTTIEGAEPKSMCIHCHHEVTIYDKKPQHVKIGIWKKGQKEPIPWYTQGCKECKKIGKSCTNPQIMEAMD